MMKGRFLTEKQIAAFAVYLKSEEKSENTVEKYIRDVMAFSAYVGIADITKEMVIAYKTNCFQKTMPHGASIQCLLLSIVCFLFLDGQI